MARRSLLILLALGLALPAAGSGFPNESWVRPDPVPVVDPVRQGKAHAPPPDFGGWVVVTLNGHPLVPPYDPIAGLSEPGPFRVRSTSRVMMPVRFFTEALGGYVQWEHESSQVRLWLKGRMVQLRIGERVALVDGERVLLDQAPLLYRDRTFVPLRILMESFGGEVAWTEFSRSARVTIPGLRCISRSYCGEVRLL